MYRELGFSESLETLTNVQQELMPGKFKGVELPLFGDSLLSAIAILNTSDCALGLLLPWVHLFHFISQKCHTSKVSNLSAPHSSREKSVSTSIALVLACKHLVVANVVLLFNVLI
jgi:hypothetical protein